MGSVGRSCLHLALATPLAASADCAIVNHDAEVEIGTDPVLLAVVAARLSLGEKQPSQPWTRPPMPRDSLAVVAHKRISAADPHEALWCLIGQQS